MLTSVNDIWEQAKKNGERTHMTTDEGVTPEVGGIYTVSPSFVNGDRSFLEQFWEVLARSGPNLLVKLHPGRSYITEPQIFPESERAWYDASEAFAVWKKEVEDES